MVDSQNIQKIEPYQRMAAYYDQLMDYIDYTTWVDDIETLVKPFDPGSTWLDISCGTGSMALLLAKRGYNMTAIDLSQHMIDIAIQKAGSTDIPVDFKIGNMVSYVDDQMYDVVINLHDGLNYLQDIADIQSFMDSTYKLLKPGGILLFDAVTPLLCQTHFRGYREIFNDEQGGYERLTNYDPISQLAESVFTLNTSEEGTVEVETHIQKAYELTDIESFCEHSKYGWWQILDDESLERGASESERFLVMLRKVT
ncbi:MAG: class I SAM-dependent methyltransferase [Candidatus Marinimicrobia bacterium]|nr:class I SAM-dependent methyltransferase [Candidatus Neomarinimicrobiota bacterium]